MKFPASITLGVRANSPRPRRRGGREGQELADAGARGGRQQRRRLHAAPHPGHVQRQHHGQDGQNLPPPRGLLCTLQGQTMSISLARHGPTLLESFVYL